MATLLEHTPASRPRKLADVLRDLGDIDAGRVHWQPLPGTAKIEDAILVNEAKRGARVELVDGVLVAKVMGFPESLLAGYILYLLRCFVDPQNLGLVAGADGMMQLFPNVLRIPDVSFVSWAMVNGKVPTEAAPVMAPDLAIEVISPGNTTKEMDRKCGEYFSSGAKAVWLVYPKTRAVEVYSSPDQYVTLTENDVISGGTVLPGFTLEVRKLFGELDRTQG